MPGHPRLSTFAFATHPVSKNIAFIGISFPDIVFVVHKMTALASTHRRISVNAFYAQIQLLNTRNVREIKPRPDGSSTWRICRRDIVMDLRVHAESHPMVQVGKAPGSVKCAKACPRI